MPLYGAGEHLEEALESILAQSYRDLAIVLTDDSPSEEVTAVLERLHDPRVTYRANPRRLGLVGNWVRAFEIAREEHPDAPYFAWGSDHDAWHPHWAERIVTAMDADPEIVLCYPQSYRMSEAGTTLTTKPARFETGAEPDPAARVRATVHGISAGNMVYGVYRAQALERAGVMRRVLLPDRLLLVEVSVIGQLRQVPERLFYRRVTGAPSIPRQRAAFWPDGAPLYSHLPWSWQHIGSLAWTLLRPGSGDERGLAVRSRIVAAHALATSRYTSQRVAGRLYFKAVGGRSMKREALKAFGRVVGHLQQRRWGRPLLALARRGLDAVGRT
jgi:hypothetical protein